MNSLDRAGVAGAIRGQQIAGTIFGTVRFDARGQMNHQYGIFTVKDGKIVVLSS